MCRVYGFRANAPTKVECTLVYAQNALLSQSRADLRGEAHPDGWGIGYYDNSVPRIERRTTAAYADLHFSAAAERMYAHTVIAHVRKATVGGVTEANTHPFTWGKWTFAHNGTVRGFDVVQDQLAPEVDPSLIRSRSGDTDSELVFYWLLSRLMRSGIDLHADCLDPVSITREIADGVTTLDKRSSMADPEKPARLNLLLTDGRVLIASRWNHTLYWVHRTGIHDCEICGIPHVHPTPRAEYLAVVVASEPISDEEWIELADGSILTVDSELRADVVLI